MSKIAFIGDITNYSFPLAGRAILLAPVNTALPTVQPVSDLNIPAGWTYLGPTENSEVNINVSIQTDAIVTGVIPAERRKYITGQSGTLEANVWRFEPTNVALISGQTAPTFTAAAGGNRAFADIWFGGMLGPKMSMLIFEDFDINLVEDAGGGRSYEQLWYYSPNVQKDGDVSLSQRVTKSPVIPIKLALLQYTNSGRNVLLQQRWIQP